MKKLEGNKVLFTIVFILITLLVAMIIYPLLDYVVSLFTNDKFEYSISDHIISPVVFSVTFGIVYSILYLRKK